MPIATRKTAIIMMSGMLSISEKSDNNFMATPPLRTRVRKTYVVLISVDGNTQKTEAYCRKRDQDKDKFINGKIFQQMRQK
jgi:hypothetical protein